MSRSPIPRFMALAAGLLGAMLVSTSTRAAVPPAPPVATLSGIVTAASDGKAVADAIVSIRDAAARTDSGGRYSLSLLTDGHVEVSASKAGFLPVTKAAVLSLGRTTELNFQLAAAAPPPSTGEVKGAVTAGGGVIAGATVSIGDATTRSDSKGQYDLSGLKPGHALVHAQAEGYLPAVQSIDVEAGTVETVNLALQKALPQPNTGVVTGTVTGEEGEAVHGALVTIGSLFISTSAKGEYTLRDVPAGNILVIAQAPGYLTAAQAENLTPGSTLMVDFKLAKRTAPRSDMGSIAGKVVANDTGKAIAGARIQLRDRTTQTDANGEFEIDNVAAGAAFVDASADGYEPGRMLVHVEADQTIQVTIALEPKETPPPPVTGTVEGKITADDGSPIAGAAVRDGGHVTDSGKDGHYKLDGLRVGMAEVEVSKPGFKAAEKSVAVVANTAVPLDFVLVESDKANPPGTGKIAGTVSDEAGQPIAGATVLLDGIHTTTDAKGQYDFSGLADGNYALQAWTEGFRHTHKRAILGSGAALTVDFTLHPIKSSGDLDAGGDDSVGSPTGSSTVSIRDVILALRIALGLDPADDLTRARVDVAPKKAHGDFGDGRIDVNDAIMLLQVATGLDLSFP